MGERLTANQERFVRALIEGKSQRQAYLTAYPTSEKWKPEQVDSKASVLFANVKVRERFNDLQDKATAPSIMSCIELKEFFTKVVNDGAEKTTDRLKAAELLGKTMAIFTEKMQIIEPPTINEDV